MPMNEEVTLEVFHLDRKTDRKMLGGQVADVARVLLRQSTSMRQMERGLHHIIPLTGVVNAVGARFGIWPFSERGLLSCLWMLLAVRTPISS